MEKAVCSTCFKPKATLSCGHCTSAICKSCACFLDADSFEFLVERPPILAHDTFCNPCFEAEVSPLLGEYNETLARAQDVQIFTKLQFKETRFLKRDQDPIVIPDCDDRDELILRLAFQAAQKGLNGVIDVETESRKVKNGSYQSTRWSGSGVPTEVIQSKLVRDRSFSNQPN
jgi:hypothetical protein